MNSKSKKKEQEEYLIKWRRKQVAEMTYENIPVVEQASILKVNERTIQRDQQYNEDHVDEMLREFIVKTVPNIIAKSLYQIDLANREAIKILKHPNNNKEALTASLTVAKTAKDVVDIVTNNKDLVDVALELDKSAQKQVDEYLDNGISTGSTKEETETADTNAKF
jgi:hypothetical protein